MKLETIINEIFLETTLHENINHYYQNQFKSNLLELKSIFL